MIETTTNRETGLPKPGIAMGGTNGIFHNLSKWLHLSICCYNITHSDITVTHIENIRCPSEQFPSARFRNIRQKMHLHIGYLHSLALCIATSKSEESLVHAFYY